MNAQTKPLAEGSAPTAAEALEAAITARLLVRAKIEQSTIVCSRSREVFAARALIVDRLVAEDEARQTSHAQKLEAYFVGGSKGDEPKLLIDANAIAALQHARTAATASERALASLEAAHAQLEDQLPAAERAVEDAITGVLVAELVPEIDRALQLEQEAALIRYRAAALGYERDRPGRPALPDAVARKLNTPTDHRIPYRPAIYSEELGANGPHKPLIAAEQQKLARRIAALREGREAV